MTEQLSNLFCLQHLKLTVDKSDTVWQYAVNHWRVSDRMYGLGHVALNNTTPNRYCSLGVKDFSLYGYVSFFYLNNTANNPTTSLKLPVQNIK